MTPVSPAQGQKGFQASQAHPSTESQDAIAAIVDRNLQEGLCLCKSVKMPCYFCIDPVTKERMFIMEQQYQRDLTVVGPYLIQEYSIDGFAKKGLVVFDSSNPTKEALSIEIQGLWEALGNDKILVKNDWNRAEPWRVFDLKTGRALAATKEAVCMRAECRESMPTVLQRGLASCMGFPPRIHGMNSNSQGASFPDGRVVSVDRCSKFYYEMLCVWNPSTQESVTRELSAAQRVEFLTTCEESVLISMVDGDRRFIGTWNPQTGEYYQFEATGLSAPITQMTLCDNGIVSGSDKGGITIWHLSAKAPIISFPVDCSSLGKQSFIRNLSPIGQWVIMRVGHGGLLVALDSENGQITVLRKAVCNGGEIEADLNKYRAQQMAGCVLLSDLPGEPERTSQRELAPEEQSFRYKDIRQVKSCPNEFAVVGSRVLFAYPDGTIRHWNAQEPHAPIIQIEPSPVVETMVGRPGWRCRTLCPDGQWRDPPITMILGDTFAAVAGGEQIVFCRSDDTDNTFLIWDFSRPCFEKRWSFPIDAMQPLPETHWLTSTIKKHILAGALSFLVGYVGTWVVMRLRRHV